MDDDTHHIVFSFNAGALAGFGATLASLARNCPATEELFLHFMCSRLDRVHKQNIERLLEQEAFRGRYRFIDYDAEAYFSGKGLPKLHGDLTAYGRLLIPDYLDVPQVLYLDCDLVIRCDIRKLCRIDIGDHLIGAKHSGSVEIANDRRLFLKQGCAAGMPYFNAGVLLINLDRWRRENVAAHWEELMLRHAEMLVSCDQTVLNYLSMGEFYSLPAKYNRIILPNHLLPTSDLEGIYHFVGAPKPWDVGGRIMHRGYELWRSYNPIFWGKKYLNLDGKRLFRGWKIRRSIIKLIGERLRRQRSW